MTKTPTIAVVDAEQDLASAYAEQAAYEANCALEVWKKSKPGSMA